MDEDVLDAYDAGVSINEMIGNTDDETNEHDELVSNEDNDVDDQDDQDDQEESEALTTLEQLAASIDMDLDDLLAIKHSFTHDGQDVEATLSELIDGNRREADYQNGMKQLSDFKNQVDQQTRQQLDEYQKKAVNLDNYLKAVDDMLVGSSNSPDMAKLKSEDPQQWMLVKHDMDERRNHIKQLKDALSNEWDNTLKSNEENMLLEMKNALARESEALKSAIPDWNDKMRDGIFQFATKQYGFTPDELSNVLDHRHVLILRDAMRYHDINSKKDVASNKVRKSPKMQSPNRSKQSNMPSNKKDMLDRRKRFMKSGSMDDAAALLTQVLS